MRIFICLDNNKGMLFNNRRQSRDKAVIADVFDSIDDGQLLISGFSEKLFSDFARRVVTDDAFLDNAHSTDNCFVENVSLKQYSHKIEEITVYNWNREYPCDFFCDLDFEGFSLVKECDLYGNSHEKITKKVYVKKEDNDE